MESNALARILHKLAIVRAIAGVFVGGAIGAIQVAIVVNGMRRSERAPGFEGLRETGKASLTYPIVTLILMLAACWLLRYRLWGLAAVSAIATELLFVAFLFAHSQQLGLHGHGRAGLFIAAAALVMGFLDFAWPTRSIDREYV